jgi:hypothetical protein
VKIPSLEQLERALHLRGAIEAAQAELSAALKSLADAVAPESHEMHEREPKGPFADSPDGARERRRQRRQQERKPRKKRTAARTRPSKRRVKSPHKMRLWSLLSGGEVDPPPTAAEPKSRRGKRPKTSASRRPRKRVRKKVRRRSG